nr:serine/arginine repetitive matrix protein 2-like [Ipomoea batatas]
MVGKVGKVRLPFRLPARPINKALARAPEDTHLSPSFPARASRPSNSLRSEYEVCQLLKSTPTHIADSQNISARDYDEAIETTPTGASSASSIGSVGEVGANDGWYPVATRALKNAVVKISAESYEYWVFRSPKTVKAAHLEPPDYSQPERMVLEWSFAPALTGPKKPHPKVTLGGSKAPLPVEAAPTQGSEPTILASSAGAAVVADLQVARATTRRGKEKAMEPEVEENPPLKRQKCTNTRGSTPVLDALREGGEQMANFLDKIRTVIPTREAIRDLETDQVGEMIAQNVLWAVENVVRWEVAPLKESLAAKDKELTEKVQALEGRIASAEREVEAAKRETAEMNEKMSSYANLTGFLCRNPQEAEAFFRAFIHNEVREELAWRYGEWAYAKGRYEMHQAVREALGESLNEKDYSTIMGVMPEPVPAPDPMP